MQKGLTAIKCKPFFYIVPEEIRTPYPMVLTKYCIRLSYGRVRRNYARLAPVIKGKPQGPRQPRGGVVGLNVN